MVKQTTATTYLTLPLELRQQILGYTFPPLLQKDLNLNRHLLDINWLLHHGSDIDPSHKIDTPLPTSAPNIHDWATALVQTHASLSHDLPFLLKPLLQEIEGTVQKISMIGKLLYPIGCEVYIDLFLENGITTEAALANLNRNKLQELGIEIWSDQFRIVWQASEWRIAAKQMENEVARGIISR